MFSSIFYAERISIIVYISRNFRCYFSPSILTSTQIADAKEAARQQKCLQVKVTDAFNKSLYLHLYKKQHWENSRFPLCNAWSVLVGGSLLTLLGRDFMFGVKL